MTPTPSVKPHQASNLDRFLNVSKTPAPKKKQWLVAEGVSFREDYKSRPYRIQKTIDKKKKDFHFATKEEAIQEREAYQQAKVDEFSAKRQALATKRAANVAKHGGKSALERRKRLV
jgi:hypothetical protein